MITTSHVLLKIIHAIRNNIQFQNEVSDVLYSDILLNNEENHGDYIKYDIAITARVFIKKFKNIYPTYLYNEPMKAHFTTDTIHDLYIYMLVIYDKKNNRLINDQYQIGREHIFYFGDNIVLDKLIDEENKEVSLRHSDSQNIIDNFKDDESYQADMANAIINDYLKTSIKNFEITIE